jgi:uncharacterized glyoxalase superfamily protein PhnB
MPALEEGRLPMPEHSVRAFDRSLLLVAEPQLFVTSIVAATDFYVDKLGFEVRMIYGEPPFWAQVARDGVRLNLRLVDAPVFEPAFLTRERDALSATIVAADANALFDEYRDRGVEFHQPLRTEPWGATTFIVADPDGNLLMFADAGPASSDSRDRMA